MVFDTFEPIYYNAYLLNTRPGDGYNYWVVYDIGDNENLEAQVYLSFENAPHAVWVKVYDSQGKLRYTTIEEKNPVFGLIYVWVLMNIYTE